MPDPFRFAGNGRWSEPFWKRRRLELHALCRLVEIESPELASITGLGLGYRRVLELFDEARTPHLLQWLSTARHLVSRDMHVTLPTGHVRDHFQDLNRIAMGASCMAGRAFEGPARLDPRAELPVPGLGIVFQAEAARASEGVAIRAGRRPAVLLDGQALGFRQLPSIGWGWRLEDAPELESAHLRKNPKWAIRRADAPYSELWTAQTAAAIGILESVQSGHWIPVRETIRSIVPLASKPDVNISGTGESALGCIASSLPEDAGILAETLAHEGAHTALHILSDVTDFWVPSARLFRSPWRKDLRPASGVIHGIYAFLSVAQMWSLLLEKGAGSRESLARWRLATVTSQVTDALDELRDADEVTPAGRRLLEEGRKRLDAQLPTSRAHPLDRGARREIENRRAAHYAALETPATLPAAPRDRAWSRSLGVCMPPPVNAPERRALRIEDISDRIHAAASRNEAAVKRWERLLGATVHAEPQSEALVRGSIAYGRNQFKVAVSAYSEYVERRWLDLDAWRLLAAALRRAGHSEDASAIAFSLKNLLSRRPEDFRRRWGPGWACHIAEMER